MCVGEMEINNLTCNFYWVEVILLASEYLPLVWIFFVWLLWNSSHLRVSEGPKNAMEKYNDNL